MTTNDKNVTMTESMIADIHDVLEHGKQFAAPRIEEMKKAVLSTLDKARVRITDSEEKAVSAFKKAYSWAVDLCKKIWSLIQRFFSMLGRGCKKVGSWFKKNDKKEIKNNVVETKLVPVSAAA